MAISSSKSTSQTLAQSIVMRCDLQKKGEAPHETLKGGLSEDPLGRMKEVDGNQTSEVMKLCAHCYRKTIQEVIASLHNSPVPQKMNSSDKAAHSASKENKSLDEGVQCDLQQGKEKPHTITKKGLLQDPLKRCKIVDGEETTDIMKICQSCYRKAYGKKLMNEGFRCDLQKEGETGHNLKQGLMKDPLKRCRIVNGEESDDLMMLCHTCYVNALNKKKKSQKGISKSDQSAHADSQEKEENNHNLQQCDLQQDGEKPHTITKKGLRKDPLGRFKIVDEKETDEIMKVCQACYKKAYGEKFMNEGLRCDLQQEEEKPHRISTKRLLQDPLKRCKIVDGEETTDIMKICQRCYRKAYGEKLMNEGFRCDLQQKGEKAHDLKVDGLLKDPLGRFKIVDEKETNEVMKLCNKCYIQAKNKLIDQNIPCDLQEEGGRVHNVKQGLWDDPLKRHKVVNGESDKIMRLCRNCLRKASNEILVKQGAFCDLQKEGEEPHLINTDGLKPDPLKRAKVIDGKEANETMKLCGRCYRSAISEKKKTKKESADQKAACEVVTIKNEPESFIEGDEDCMVTGESITQHKVDNFLPILQDPENPNRSLLLEKEGSIDEIRCANWSVLSHLKKAEKEQIIKQVHEWLRLNEYEREKYAQRIESYLEVSTPIDDGPDRGVSVFAKRDIKANEVVCPYTGILHPDHESLTNAIRKKGSENILAYLFGTRSAKRSIDAYTTGGTASLVNTSQLGDYPAFKKNNLAPVLFGKNIIVYVALEDIKKGTELLIDYGPHYNPLERAEEAFSVKEEDRDFLSS